MKKIYFNLFAIVLFTFNFSNLSGQFKVNAYTTDSNCNEYTLSLNETTELSESDCEYSTNFSNVQSGTNTLEITSDLNPLYKTSIIDMVKVMRSMDEGFESYAVGMAADFNSDLVISTDDLVKMRRTILGIESDVPTKVKLASIDQVFELFTDFELDSDHTTYSFEDDEVENGVATDLFIVIVGHIE